MPLSSSEPLLLTIRSTKLVINELVRELLLNVVLEAIAHNPPYFNVENENVDFAKRIILWMYAG
jgi:hypothetical protein